MILLNWIEIVFPAKRWGDPGEFQIYVCIPDDCWGEAFFTLSQSSFPDLCWVNSKDCSGCCFPDDCWGDPIGKVILVFPTNVGASSIFPASLSAGMFFC